MPHQTTRDADTLTITTTGRLTAERIVEIAREHYPGLDNRSVLWDFTASDLTGISREGITAIAMTIRTLLPREGSRKTAFVVADLANYVRVCSYVNEAVTVRMPTEYAVFMTVPQAQSWLKQP